MLHLINNDHYILLVFAVAYCYIIDLNLFNLLQFKNFKFSLKTLNRLIKGQTIVSSTPAPSSNTFQNNNATPASVTSPINGSLGESTQNTNANNTGTSTTQNNSIKGDSSTITEDSKQPITPTRILE